MGKYTVLEDPRVDECIDQCLARIVSVLVCNLPNIRSIMLSGSFGKGQGSVYLDHNGIRPQRDIDICVIFKKTPPPRDLVSRLQRELQNELCSMEGSDDYYLMGNLLPEIGVTTLDNINSLPDITSYDLKFCKVVYGEDIRPKIKWTLGDLPLRTNARALFQKGIALIGALRSEYPFSGIPPQLKASFLRETSRAYIEICVGLCLLAKRYDWSCIKRLETLREIYRTDFKDLYEKIPNLVDKIEVSTKYKLDPSNNEIDADPLDYWFETRDDLGEVMKFYFNRYLNIGFDNWIGFSALLEKKLTKEYYVPVANAFLRNRNLPSNRFVSSLATLTFNVRENFEYSRSSLKRGQLSLPLLSGISSPEIRVFTAIPLTLFSINQDRSINSEYVDLALRKLGFMKMGHKKSNDSWAELRYKLLKLVFSVNMI